MLAREQHLSQLDGLAAAAAHELGTPLSTISVIASELERAIAPHAPHGDDVRLLREQATRCRDILAKLTELSAGGEPFDRMPLTALIEEVVAPHRNFGVAIAVTHPSDAPQSRSARATRQSSTASATCWKTRSISRTTRPWSMCTGTRTVDVTISDDGPGFAPEILGRIGEPYVTSRHHQPDDTSEESSGLGLGFFIAKTLLERSGATLSSKIGHPSMARSSG